MSKNNNHSPRLLALDTGGTMTDSFAIDQQGRYTVGKAQTTPDNESKGVRNSFEDGLGYWDTSLQKGISELNGCTYSGTAMLNRLLEREGNGEDIGIVTTHGFEDTLRFGRGIQSWTGMSYSSRLHAREHELPEPLVPRENIKGVRERIDTIGDVEIPLYEDEAREVLRELLQRDLRVICVNFLQSFRNPVHEERFMEIAEEVKDELGVDTPIWLASDQNPISGELPRLNTLVVEAYAVEPSRKQLHSVRETLQGDKETPFRVLTSSGGTISPDHDWLVETLVSGPIGGVFGGEYLANELGIDNLVCSDVGGTSFDVALITEGHYPTRWDQSLAKHLLNIPMTAMDSIGSGTGSFLNVDPASGRIEVGPESAGYQVGVCNVEAGLETPTVTDCTLMLGYLNPDNFLGGDIELDVDRSVEYIEDQLANEIGEDPYETARGVLDIVDQDMANELNAMIVGLGYSPENYSLVSFGGGGPLHTAGYTRQSDYQDVMIPEWAAAFSAFGAACADYSYRYDQTMDAAIEPDFSNIESVTAWLNDTLMELRDQALDALARDGVETEEVEFQPSLEIHYTNMLADLEVQVPTEFWDDETGLDTSDLKTVIEDFESQFERIFQRGAKAPEFGFTIKTATGVGVAPSPKPSIPHVDLVSSDNPPNAAHKGQRSIYWESEWHDADIWEMEEINPGNVIMGPSVVEAPATTMLIPPGFETELDEHRIYHLEKQE